MLSIRAKSLLFIGLTLSFFSAAKTSTAQTQQRKQTSGQLKIRKPGQRFLGPPMPIGNEAKTDLPFAWLSVVAYQHPHAMPACPDPATALQAAGWTSWPDNLKNDPTLVKHLKGSHLRFEVWANPSTGQVVVAFGGTDFTNLKDWESNLRWINPIRHDEYTKIVHFFGPAFVREYVRLEATPEYAFLHGARLYSTGHSLGGGLAQQFAYALPADERVPRVSIVYAFDTSPVTGASSVPKHPRKNNEKDLQIDRIYEQGEILASLRTVTNFFYKPHASAPRIRQVRFDLFRGGSPVGDHSIPQLACHLYEASLVPDAAIALDAGQPTR